MLGESDLFIRLFLTAYAAAVVTGNPRRLFGTPERRAVGWLVLAAMTAAVAAWMADSGRLPWAVSYLGYTALCLWISRTLWTRRPIGANPVELRDMVETPDGFVGRVVDIEPWAWAVTIEGFAGDRHTYPTDKVRKINGGRSG